MTPGAPHQGSQITGGCPVGTTKRVPSIPGLTPRGAPPLAVGDPALVRGGGGLGPGLRPGGFLAIAFRAA